MDVSYEFPECKGTLVLQPAPMPEKKPNLWFSGVLTCMSSVLGVFGKQDLLDDYSDDSFYIKPDRIIESQCIGEGAQGRVHLATLKLKNGQQTTVAIKYVQEIDQMTARHLRKIYHENIVQTIGVCMHPPKYYIVMEYCENGSLFDFMRNGGQFSPQQMLKWAREVACGMLHLHNRKIVHRDLKSPNVLITSNLTAKISDFGTCRTIEKTCKMSFAGTVHWMAPEVIRAESYSEKIDVWSFGVVLWELVTRQVPYSEMEQHAIMWGVGTDSVSLPIPMGVPSSVHVLLVQCWNRKYAQRPSFATIIESLDMIAEEFMQLDARTFLERQNAWSREAKESLEKAFIRSEELCKKKIPIYTQLDLYNRRDLKDKRNALNLRLDQTNDLFFEVCSVRLALEMRERDLAEKERVVDLCRCGMRRLMKLHETKSSSSSDALAMIYGYRAHLKKEPDANLFVNLVKDKTMSALDCECQDKVNSNIANDCIESRKETVVEVNGNLVKVKKVRGGKTDMAIAQV